jgi:hypothetical protein
VSIEMDGEVKRWTARRKSALVLEILQGRTTVSAAARGGAPTKSPSAPLGRDTPQRRPPRSSSR